MDIHWLWYVQLQGMTHQQKLEVLERCETAENIFRMNKAQLIQLQVTDPGILKALADKNMVQAMQIEEDCKREGIRILTYADQRYPEKLRTIADAPLLLYYRGELPDFSAQPVIAVVGTRKASAYGLSATRKLSREITRCGAMVISGGAAGVDTEAMRAALDEGGVCVGVLGCGIDVVYPVRNQTMFRAVEKSGCLISEYPPGTPPLQWHFPHRNRIVSGIANAVLVTEAPKSSGALITARLAMEQGTEVFCVPVNIDHASGAGSNALLGKGATTACEGWDVVKHFAHMFPQAVHCCEPVDMETPRGGSFAYVGICADKKHVDNRQPTPYSVNEETMNQLSQEEQKVYACLSAEPMTMDAIIEKTGGNAAGVTGILTRLSIKGVVQFHPGRLVSAKIQNH